MYPAASVTSQNGQRTLTNNTNAVLHLKFDLSNQTILVEIMPQESKTIAEKRSFQIGGVNIPHTGKKNVKAEAAYFGPDRSIGMGRVVIYVINLDQDRSRIYVWNRTHKEELVVIHRGATELKTSIQPGNIRSRPMSSDLHQLDGNILRNGRVLIKSGSGRYHHATWLFDQTCTPVVKTPTSLPITAARLGAEIIKITGFNASSNPVVTWHLTGHNLISTPNWNKLMNEIKCCCQASGKIKRAYHKLVLYCNNASVNDFAEELIRGFFIKLGLGATLISMMGELDYRLGFRTLQEGSGIYIQGSVDEISGGDLQSALLRTSELKSPPSYFNHGNQLKNNKLLKTMEYKRNPLIGIKAASSHKRSQIKLDVPGT